MAEMLVYMAEATGSPDQTIAVDQFQPGMVVTIREDGFAWSEFDLARHVKLVKVPGAAAAAMQYLTAEMLDEVPALGVMPTLAKIRVWQANDPAALPDVVSLDQPVTQAAIDAWVNANFTPLTPDPLNDPRVIG